MNKHIEISTEGEQSPNLQPKDLKKVLKKIKPWGGTDWDLLAAFWWKKITRAHNVLLQIVTSLFAEGDCRECETLRRTVLIGKRRKDLRKTRTFQTHYLPFCDL